MTRTYDDWLTTDDTANAPPPSDEADELEEPTDVFAGIELRDAEQVRARATSAAGPDDIEF
jgi:hypothetical protein